MVFVTGAISIHPVRSATESVVRGEGREIIGQFPCQTHCAEISCCECCATHATALPGWPSKRKCCLRLWLYDGIGPRRYPCLHEPDSWIPSIIYWSYTLGETTAMSGLLQTLCTRPEWSVNECNKTCHSRFEDRYSAIVRANCSRSQSNQNKTKHSAVQNARAYSGIFQWSSLRTGRLYRQQLVRFSVAGGLHDLSVWATTVWIASHFSLHRRDVNRGISLRSW